MLLHFVQVTVIAIGAFMVQQWHGPPWNAPIWPLIPLLLNRSIEVAALCLNNIFTSITVSSHILAQRLLDRTAVAAQV